jgi:TonB family protein
MKVMKYLLTLLLFVVSTAAISQNKYSYFVNDAAYTRFSGVKIQVIHLKSLKIKQERTSDSLGAVHFDPFNKKAHQFRALIKDNLHLDSTIHSSDDYILSIKGNKDFYDSIQVIKDSTQNISNQLKFSKLYPDKWRQIDAYYDSLNIKLPSKKKADSIFWLNQSSKIKDTTILGIRPVISGPTKKSWDRFNTFIKENLIYPQFSQDLGDEGKVYIEFTIQTDGKITHVKILRGVSDEIDFEAINVMRKIPFRMEPCSEVGILIPCNYSFPITFKLG